MLNALLTRNKVSRKAIEDLVSGMMGQESPVAEDEEDVADEATKQDAIAEAVKIVGRGLKVGK